ncbi:MADS-box domain-containing protein [Abeliophyllum distichum]|uniref:MADS-box domain-containing protein n=1 Tax=Abeliophyllum distichum TaxID=126358 RepID=A0ABD1PS54_9LAMI
MSSLFLSPKENNNQTNTMSTKKTQKASAIKKSFKTRKESIKKKTMELSVLCDVNACAVIIGPDGSIETWPEDRNHVQQVIQQYRNCDRKRKRTQELDHGCDDHCKKKQDVRFVSEGSVKNQGTTNQELLTVIDAKLAQGTGFGCSRLTMRVLFEMDLMNILMVYRRRCPYFKKRLLVITLCELPGTFALPYDQNRGGEFLETFVSPNDQEFQPFTTTMNTFNSGSELLETFVFPNEQEFQSGSELLETFVFPNEQEFQPFATTMKTFDSGSVFVDSSALWWDDAAADLWV